MTLPTANPLSTLTRVHTGKQSHSPPKKTGWSFLYNSELDKCSLDEYNLADKEMRRKLEEKRYQDFLDKKT